MQENKVVNKDVNKAPYPHCDNLVLHAPRKCRFCDMYPEKQQERIKTGTNFTGENDPSKYPCPAQLQRSERDINKWHGNWPEPLERAIIRKGNSDAT